MSDALHRECTRLVNTYQSQGVVREVHARLFGEERRVSPPVYESKPPATDGNRIDLLRCFCICFRDEKIA